jgi:hypothetical protein
MCLRGWEALDVSHIQDDGVVDDAIYNRQSGHWIIQEDYPVYDQRTSRSVDENTPRHLEEKDGCH